MHMNKVGFSVINSRIFYDLKTITQEFSIAEKELMQ